MDDMSPVGTRIALIKVTPLETIRVAFLPVRTSPAAGAVEISKVK